MLRPAFEERRVASDAGVVDEDVVGAGRPDEPVDLGPVGDVEPRGLRRPAGVANGFRARLDIVERARRETDMRARFRQRRRRCEPDAAAGAGDERAPAVEPQAWRPRELHGASA